MTPGRTSRARAPGSGPSAFHGYGNEPGADEREEVDGAGVGRGLDEQGVTRIEQGARHEIEPLLAAGGDDDLFGAHGNAALDEVASDLLAQPRRAFGGRVAERAEPVPGQNVGDAAAQQRFGDEIIPRLHAR